MEPVGVLPAEAHEQLELLLLEKRYGAFVRLLNESLRHFGPSADLYRFAANYARETDKPAELARFLMQWAGIAPEDPSPCWELAELFAALGKVDNAVEALDLAEKAGADPIQVAVRRVQVLLAGGQYARAADEAMRALVGQQAIVPVVHLLGGLSVLAANLAVAQKRLDLRDLVRLVAKRLQGLQADAAGLLLVVKTGEVRRLGPSKVNPGLVDQLTHEIKTRNCGCVIGSADLMDLVRPAAKVHDGSFWGSRSRVYMVECDEDLLALALATFDVRDVLADEAVTWVWGPTGLGQLERYLTERDEEPPMNVTVSSNPQVGAIVDRASQAFHEKAEAWFRESSAYYASLPREHWRDILGDSPSRPPRVLFVTTQFSSYMKFAIRDLATTFERLGWQVQVAKESRPTHRVSGTTVPKLVATFRPDLIWQVNYTRSSWEGAIPNSVPFVCWNQDNMPHLLSRDTAARMGHFDFLACLGSGVGYTHWYGYTPDRLVSLSTCVDRSIFRPGPSGTPTADMAYVSHQGWPVEERIENVIAGLSDEHRQALRPVLKDYAATLSKLFQQNGDPLTKEHCGQILVQTLRRYGFQMPEESLGPLHHHSHHAVANAIWRHQAVRWAADCGASLALHGFGWDQNPEFSRFAKGVVEHGEELATVFRTSRIALQAVLAGNEHQRLWEAAACGVPVVMRYHPLDESFAIVRGWLDRLEKGSGRPLAEVFSLPADASIGERFSWRAIRVLAAEDGIVTDQVLQYAGRMADTLCVRDKLGEVYDEVSFRTPEQLRCQMDRLLHDAAARKRVSEQMLRATDYHDYSIQIPRVVRDIRQRLLA